MPESLSGAYKAMIDSCAISEDVAQRNIITDLQTIQDQLEATSAKRGVLTALFRKQNTPRGLYIWGSVGRGKSMLMDLFFSTVQIERKRRVHFHAFMQEIHSLIHAARKSGASDPIEPAAAEIAKDVRLLCFDEMQITDITDAMIVGRLFEQLFQNGVTIVLTSNRPPDGLYENGLNRQLFLPFIDLLNKNLDVQQLDGGVDYRQDFLRGQQTYFSPNDDAARAAMDKIWHELTGDGASSLTLKVKSRDVTLPAFQNGVARASFADLCENPLGPADFLAISGAVRVLFLDDIPKMNRAKNNEAKRFVTLIDTLYEAKTQLICSAADVPEALYETGAGSFEFGRTASRLREMQGAQWGQPAT